MVKNKRFIFAHIMIGLAAMSALPLILLTPMGLNMAVLGILVLGLGNILIALYHHKTPYLGELKFLQKISLILSCAMIFWCGFHAQHAMIFWGVALLPLQSAFIFKGRFWLLSAVLAAFCVFAAYGTGLGEFASLSNEVNFIILALSLFVILGGAVLAYGIFEQAFLNKTKKTPKEHRVKNIDEMERQEVPLQVPQGIPLHAQLTKIEVVPGAATTSMVYLNELETAQNIDEAQNLKPDFKEITRFVEYTAHLEAVQGGLIKKSA